MEKHIEKLIAKAGQTRNETVRAIATSDIFHCDEDVMFCANVDRDERLAFITQVSGNVKKIEDAIIENMKDLGVKRVVALSTRKGAEKIFPEKYGMKLIGHIYEREI